MHVIILLVCEPPSILVRQETNDKTSTCLKLEVIPDNGQQFQLLIAHDIINSNWDNIN